MNGHDVTPASVFAAGGSRHEPRAVQSGTGFSPRSAKNPRQI